MKSNNLSGVGTMGLAISTDVMQELFDLRYFILILVLLITADLYFGIRESRTKGQRIRRSRALRRSLNKFMDYIFAIMFVCLLHIFFLQHNLSIPYFPLFAFGLVSLFELESVINHWLVLHHREEINFKNLFKAIVKEKRKDISNIAEDYQKSEKKTKRKKKEEEKDD